MKYFLLALIFASGCNLQPAFAQVADAPEPYLHRRADNPPVITDAQKLAYFRSQLQAQAAQIRLQDAEKAIVDTCGKDFTPSMDAKGEPVCVVRDAPVKK